LVVENEKGDILLENIQKYVMPQFQRLFVWQQNEIYELVDSLARGYSPGLIIIWETKFFSKSNYMFINIIY